MIFKKGDRVITTKMRDAAPIGMIGTIVIEKGIGICDCGIEFDTKFKLGHTLRYKGENYSNKGYGYWFNDDEIKQYYKDYKKNNEIKCMTCFKEFKGKDIKRHNCPYCKSYTIVKIENV